MAAADQCYRHNDFSGYAALGRLCRIGQELVAGISSTRDASGSRRNVADGDSPNNDL